MVKEDVKILLVEDDLYLLEILDRKLKHEGFGVDYATDGEAGLKKAIDLHPDLIILDILMPKKNGIAMLKELREDSWGKNVPVIILSNLNSTESMQETLEKGAIDYIVKSHWDTDKVIARIKERLQCQ